MGRLRLGRARLLLLRFSYAPPPAPTQAAPSQKRFVCSAGGNKCPPAPANVLWFPLAGRRGVVPPALPGLSAWVVCPHHVAPPSPPNYNARKVRCALGSCGARARSRSARLTSRVPSPRTPARFKFVLTFARRALTHPRPRGVVWGGVCAEHTCKSL